MREQSLSPADPIQLHIEHAFESTQSVDERVRPLLELLQFVSGFESTYLTWIDHEGGALHVLFSHNAGQLTIAEGQAVPWDQTLCRLALDEGKPFVDDVTQRWGEVPAARDFGLKTFASVPVRAADDSLYGTLCGASTSQHAIGSRTERTFALFARVLEQEIQQERLLQQLVAANSALAASASTDSLTGIPNRRAVYSELRRVFASARRHRQWVMVAYLDLDGFKRINDAHGHEVGDAFLIEVSKRLASSLRGGDLLGRVGGDEFVMIGAGPPLDQDGVAAAAGLQERLSARVVGRYSLPGRIELDYSGASIGVICAQPERDNPESTLRLADDAMYAEKRRRRDAAL
jgi:diguanylate cyclase